jgi:hypothetical protein
MTLRYQAVADAAASTHAAAGRRHALTVGQVRRVPADPAAIASAVDELGRTPIRAEGSCGQQESPEI